MTISRWKVMAGVLGVSLGGLAAIAGQCPKPDATKTQRAGDPLVVTETPKVPPGGSGPVAPAVPAVPAAKSTGTVVPPVDLPAPPPADLLVPPTSAVAPKLPAVPLPAGAPVQPAKSADLPTLFPSAGPVKPDLPKPDVTPVGASILPAPPAGPATLPASPVGAGDPLPPVKVVPPSAAGVSSELPKPTTIPSAGTDPVTPKSVPVELTKPTAGPAAQAPPALEPVVESAPAKPLVVAAATTPVVTKFRIVLRVGEGEPMFEVRHGDDLVMKVVCEKVDIKSPEKGQGLSAVTATGKVRFVGFGAEGTCDSFSFLAGTGEVAMTGSVKVQVKDKIGRVESELTTEKMQYRLDSNAMPGVLKP